MKNPETDLYNKKEDSRMLLHSAIENYVEDMKNYGGTEEDIMDEISDIFHDLQLPLEVVLS